MSSELAYQPGYLKMMATKEIDQKINLLSAMLEKCNLCPRNCLVNRLQGEKGFCQAGKEIEISSFGPHLGEEQPLVGEKSLKLASLGRIKSIGGSGTIFFTHCGLRCVYCQNYTISHLGDGHMVTPDRLARIMLDLQKSGCHNLNLVTPTHYTPQIVKSLKIASSMGLKLPIVYNCSGYEKVETLNLLAGLIDIYLPDFKYGSREAAERYSASPDYFEICKLAIKEMHRQVGDLKMNSVNLAFRGIILRHLVLPNEVASSRNILQFLAREVSPNTYLNIMDQYRPMYRASQYSEINRICSRQEIGQVYLLAKELGFTRLDKDF